MDPELREALDRLEAGLRQHIDTTAESLRAEIRAGDAETRESLRAQIQAGDAETRASLSARIEAGDAETRASLSARIEAGDAETRASLSARIEAGDAETRRHVGVLNEGLRGDFRIATEGIDALNQKFDALRGDHEHNRRRLDLLEVRVTVLERDSPSGPRRRRPR